MDGQLHCLHCYGQAYVSLYSACAFADLQGKVLQGTHKVAELSATAFFANPLMAYFPNCLIFVSLLQDLKTACFFYVPEMFFPSPNSADTSSTSQDSHCTSETKKSPAEGQGRIK